MSFGGKISLGGNVDRLTQWCNYRITTVLLKGFKAELFFDLYGLIFMVSYLLSSNDMFSVFVSENIFLELPVL